MFEFNPELMLGDDDDADEGVIEREKEEVRFLYSIYMKSCIGTYMLLI